MNSRSPRIEFEHRDAGTAGSSVPPALRAHGSGDKSRTTGSGQELQPDIAQARKFLELLDENAEAFTFQTFDESGQKRPTLTRVFHGRLEDHWVRLVELNRRGAGIFVAVNETDLAGRKRENMRRIRCVYQDDDNGEQKDYPIDPHIVVQTSPGRHQRYWICDGPSGDDDGVDTEALALEFQSVEERLIADHGSDPGAKDVTRVLRLPGFYHRKGEPHLVRIVEENPRLPFGWNEIKAAFPAIEPGQSAAASAIVKDDKGVVVDGRDQFLSNLAYREVCRAIEANIIAGKAKHDLDVDRIAGLVHTLFIQQAETDRPMGMDRTRYQELVATGNPVTGPRWDRAATRQKVEEKIRAARAGKIPIDQPQDAGSGDSGELGAFVGKLLDDAAENAGAPFRSENLARLAEIRSKRPDVYENALSRLKQTKTVRTGELDREVKKLMQGGDDSSQGQKLALDPPVPWPDPVDATELLDEMVAIVRRFVVLPDHSAEMVALWCVYTHCLDAFRIAPRLAFLAPEKNSGKSTALSVVQLLACKPLAAANTTSAAVFRVIEAHQPTLIIDEADTFLRDDSDLRGILNSGHDRPNAYVLRVVGDDHEPRQFKTFAPVAFAAIGKLPETIMDRSIIISMQRKAPTEEVEKFRLDRTEAFEPLRRKAARWAGDNMRALREADPEMPIGFGNRAADNIRNLLAIADAAGGHWPATARTAASAIYRPDDDMSLGVMLLADMREMFAAEGVDELRSGIVIERLSRLESRPWPEYKNGKEMTAAQLAKLLARYRIAPQNLRVADGRVAKGYKLTAFKEAFQRYLPPPAG